MAIVDITEYDALALDKSGNAVQTGIEAAAVPNQQVAITAGTLQSAAFAESTRFVRVHADAPARIAFGANPTAAPTSMRIAAGATEYFGVKKDSTGVTMKIAVITTT